MFIPEILENTDMHKNMLLISPSTKTELLILDGVLFILSYAHIVSYTE